MRVLSLLIFMVVEVLTLFDNMLVISGKSGLEILKKIAVNHD